MKKLIETTKNNTEVFIGEETIKHMEAHSDVSIKHIKDAIKKITLNGTFFMESINMGKNVGKDHCIKIMPEDFEKIKMVQRPNRKGLTPMIEAEPEDTELLTIGLCIDEDDGKWTLFTAFYGIKAPREPWDTHTDEERAESETFWNCHALCI